MIDAFLITLLFGIGALDRLVVMPLSLIQGQSTLSNSVKSHPFYYIGYSWLIFILKFVIFGWIWSFNSILLCMFYDLMIQLMDILAYGYFYRESGTILGDQMGSFMVSRELISFGVRNTALLFTCLHYYPALAFGTWGHRYVDTVVKYHVFSGNASYYNVMSELSLWIMLLCYSFWGSTYIGCGMCLFYVYYVLSISPALMSQKN